MPIIVDEVVISVEVTNAAAGGAAAPASGGGSTEDKQALISECVEQVMELLRQREER